MIIFVSLTNYSLLNLKNHEKKESRHHSAIGVMY